jgi:hypothetical protein
MLRGCNLHPTRWRTWFLRAPLPYTLTPHVRLPGALQMVASSRRTELNGILACLPDGATIRITYEAAYCRLTTTQGSSRQRGTGATVSAPCLSILAHLSHGQAPQRPHGRCSAARPVSFSGSRCKQISSSRRFPNPTQSPGKVAE